MKFGGFLLILLTCGGLSHAQDDQSSNPKASGSPPVASEESGITRPRAIYAPDPEYSDEGRKKKINGTVELSLTVGTDGLAHDIKVEKKLGHGLDEKAVEALRRWKFQPALKDGKPCEAHLQVAMTFKIY